MNVSTAWHSPAVGMVPPHGSVTVTFQLPIDLVRNKPIVLTASGKGSVIIRDMSPREVVLENPTAKLAPYVLIIVPTKMIDAATTDWKEVFRALKLKFASAAKSAKERATKPK